MRRQSSHWRNLREISAEGSASMGSSIKLEPAFLAQNEEALLAAGSVKQGQNKRTAKKGKEVYSHGSEQRSRGQEVRTKSYRSGWQAINL